MRTGGPAVAPYVPKAEGLLSPRSAADWLDTSRATVYRLMASGDVPFVRLGNQRRIRVTDLEAYVSRLAADVDSDLSANFNVVGGSR